MVVSLLTPSSAKTLEVGWGGGGGVDCKTAVFFCERARAVFEWRGANVKTECETGENFPLPSFLRLTHSGKESA